MAMRKLKIIPPYVTLMQINGLGGPRGKPSRRIPPRGEPPGWPYLVLKTDGIVILFTKEVNSRKKGRKLANGRCPG
jgi:hypothetical protein